MRVRCSINHARQMLDQTRVHYCLTVSLATIYFNGFINPNTSVSPIHVPRGLSDDITDDASDDDSTAYKYNVTVYWCDRCRVALGTSIARGTCLPATCTDADAAILGNKSLSAIFPSLAYVNDAQGFCGAGEAFVAAD